jgi:hypothetical protein
MKTQDVKKIVELQGKIIKLRERILNDVKRHNDMVISELRPLTTDVLHNTIYELNGVTYKRGRVFSQLDCQDYGLGPKADGLATLRKVEVKDAPSNNEESGPSTPLSE